MEILIFIEAVLTNNFNLFLMKYTLGRNLMVLLLKILFLANTKAIKCSIAVLS